MPGTLNLKIITPERIVLDQPIKSVIAMGTDGEFEVLPGHEPLVATLAIDVVDYDDEKGEHHAAAVMGGLLEVRGNEVTILSDVAELSGEIDAARAEQAKERAAAHKLQRTDQLEVKLSEMALSRAFARLNAAELRQTRRRRAMK
jgi:F-type H+-transporting ATPase subunit epsilon